MCGGRASYPCTRRRPFSAGKGSERKASSMHLHELRDALHRRPFTPFRLYVSGGETFDIHHPELCVSGLRSAFIGFPAPGEAQPTYDRYTIVDLFHVIRLEPLETAKSAGNGQ